MNSSQPSQSDVTRELAALLLGALAIVFGSALLGLAVNHFSPRGLPLFPAFAPPGALSHAAEPGIPLPPGLKPIGVAEARTALDEGSSVFVDARPASEYAEAHIAGALNLPPSQFEELFPDLADRVEGAATIIVYCSGAECSDSVEVGERLQETGDHAIYVLEAGWRAWAEAGYPTATGPEP